MANPNFLHLPVPRMLQGAAKLSGGGNSSDEVKENKKNFKAHATFISNKFASARNSYKNTLNKRKKENLPELPANTPFLLRIDEGSDPEFIVALGLEIVAETPDGVILVSSDDLSAEHFEENIQRFSTEVRGGAKVANLLDLISLEKIDERLSRILSPELLEKFYDLHDDAQLVLDIGVECQGPERLPKYPDRNENDTDERYATKTENWHKRYGVALEKIENLQIEREQDFLDFVDSYEGEALDITQEQREHVLPDSFTVRVNLSGLALRDLASNHPFVFDIQEADILSIDDAADTEWKYDLDFELLAPTEDAQCLAIVDSGIQEQHPMLSAAVIDASICLIPGEDGNVADYVAPAGHGTRVAGSAIYRNADFPAAGVAFTPPIWIKNIRVLNSDNSLPAELFPPKMMESVAKACLEGEHVAGTINLSVSALYPCRPSYMSAWAASIDEVSNREDLLFVTCTGNLPDESISSRLGVVSAISNGYEYPDFLLKPGCRIANPAQSFQALTVGATSTGDFDDFDFRSLNVSDMPASYSATGYGIWGSIKPEVVVPVGDFVFSKAEPLVARVDESVAAPLVRSTLHGGPLTERDGIGTSFAAPAVASICAELQEVYPFANALVRKAIVVSAASWPNWVSIEQRELALRTMGYGIVDFEKALENDDHRVCLVSDGSLTMEQKQTHVYKIPVPEQIRGPENESIVRVSVTLCFSAYPRRTRSNLKRYFSSWLDWRSSRRSESFESFASVTCKDADQNVALTDDGAFPWVIGSASNYGIVGVTRSNSACQKDWFEIPAHELPDEFGIAVSSHQGWDTNLESECKYALVVAFESVGQQMPIYVPIQVAVEELVNSLEAEIEI